MGYMHIDNLYRDDRIFKYDECYCLEKIHGTSAHFSLKIEGGLPQINFFSGGASYEAFKALFIEGELFTRLMTFLREPLTEVIIFGEAYGGKMQGMSATYGPELKFIVFDVKLNGRWLNVPEAEAVAEAAGLEFVDYVRISTKLADIDAERAKPSVQARRNGVTEPKEREGIVLRPIEEAYDQRGNRIITKHKNDSFKETKTPRQVDPERLQILADAKKIADEWVTEMRMDHVLTQAQILLTEVKELAGERSFDITDTGAIVKLMIADVQREAKGEILESKEAMKEIGSAAARLFKKRLNDQLHKGDLI